MYRKLAEEMIGHIGRMMSKPEPMKIDRFLVGEYAVLGYLITHEQVRPGDLCEALGMSSAHVSKTLRNLEAKGEISRTMDQSDHRKTLIILHASGRDRMEGGWNHVVADISGKLEAMGEQDAKDFVRLLGRLAETSGG